MRKLFTFFLVAVILLGGVYGKARPAIWPGSSQEEIQVLDVIARKLALLAPNAPQNQIESITAIEAVEVELSQACDAPE